MRLDHTVSRLIGFGRNAASAARVCVSKSVHIMTAAIPPISRSFSSLLSRRLLWVMGAFLAVAAAVPVHADSSDVLKRVQRDGQARVIVRMKAVAAGVPWSAIQSTVRQRAAVAAALENTEASFRNARVRPTKTFRTLPFMGATVNQEQLLELMASPDVESVSLVRRERRMENATRSLESIQVSTGIASIDVASAWSRGFDGSGYAIAVIDDGFNFNHPMLKGKNTGDACFSSDFGTTTKNNCPSGTTPQIGPGAASNCPAGGTRCGHGTHVASVAAGNDGVNFGVARGAKIVPIDVFSTETDATACFPDAAPCELTDTLVVLDALDYINEHAAELKIAAVNYSVGGTTRDGYCDEDPRKSVIDMLRQKGIAVVAAAGNNGLTGKTITPACISSAVAVGATNDDTTIASFSNFASILDFMAPGVSVAGASNTGTGLVVKSGTSMSTPHVAGAWAVMRSAFPSATFEQIENILKETGLAVTRINSGITVPKIQISKAIDRPQGKDRQFLSNIISPNAQYLGRSYLRFFNNSAAKGTVTITLRDVGTGEAVGTWTSTAISANAAPQIDLQTIEKNATPVNAARPITDTTRTYYNFEISSSFAGYMQHVLWSPEPGVLGNLTSCATGFSSDASTAGNVYASASGGYLSRVRIVNAGGTPDSAVLIYYNTETGAEIGRWTSGAIAAGAAVEMTPAYLESQLPALKAAVDTGLAQYSIKLSKLAGYVQHVVLNGSIGVLMDMSPKCDLRATSTAAITTSVP